MAWEWRGNWINTHWIEEMNLEIYALCMFTSWFVKSLLTDFNIYVSSWYSAQVRHLRSIYCSLGFWGPILPIALRIGALAALAAPAASPALNILFIGLLGPHTAYSTSNWSSGCAGCVGCAQLHQLRWLRLLRHMRYIYSHWAFGDPYCL